MKVRRKKKTAYNPHMGKLKPYKIPEDMHVVVDTREQKPLFKRIPPGLTIVSKALKDGDYSIVGFEDRFCIERKEMSDFYGYIGNERTKTVAKMERFAEMVKADGFVMLAIEAAEEDVLFGYEYSRLSPEVARQAINSFRLRYGVHVYCNRDRTFIERTILDSMIKFYGIQREV